MLHRLANPVQEYAWGSRTYLPDLLGRPGTGRPQAELWIGAHPLLPSRVVPSVSSRHSQSLPELIRAAPESLLGSEVLARFGPRLPFLLKVLAVAQPLSLQVHPTTTRAAEGFAVEQAAGIGLTERARSYKDPFGKPELTYAVTAFETMCGYRRPRETAAQLRMLASHSAGRSFFHDALDDLDRVDERAAVRRVTARALALPEPDTRRWVEVVCGAAGEAADDAARVAAGLGERFPADPGVLVTLLMNRVLLEPGQVLLVSPGTLHAHLAGVAVEAMACSDNTLRGGLTDKHVDTTELMAALDDRVGPARLLAGHRVSEGERTFSAGLEEVELSVIRGVPGRSTSWAGGRPRTVLVLEGQFRLDDATTELVLQRGEAVFVPASIRGVRASGSGTLVTVSTGVGPGAR